MTSDDRNESLSRVRRLEAQAVAHPERDILDELIPAFLNAGLNEQVLEYREQLQRHNSEQRTCWLAEASYRLEDFRSAISFANQALSTNPDCKNALLLIAESHFRLGNWEIVAKTIDESLETFPEGAEFWQLSSRLLRERGDNVAGHEAALKAVQFGPEDPWNHVYLANSYWLRQEIDKADSSYQKAIEFSFSDSMRKCMEEFYVDFLHEVRKVDD